MKRLHIIGRKNHGKTTLIVDLVGEFTRRGHKVGTLKHTHHRHELDTPGKDSHRHRQAGAAVVGILSPSLNAIFWPDEADHDDTGRYREFSPFFANCNLVLVEGDSQTDGLKIEVWRAGEGTPPLAAEDATIRAVVTDDSCAVNCPTLSRTKIADLADWIANLLFVGD